MRVYSVWLCRAGPHYTGAKETVARVTMFDGSVRDYKFGMDETDTLIYVQLNRMLRAKRRKNSAEAIW